MFSPSYELLDQLFLDITSEINDMFTTKCKVGVKNKVTAVDIGPPTDMRREIHVTKNPETGKLEGLPRAWSKFWDKLSSSSKQNEDHEVAKETSKFYTTESHEVAKDTAKFYTTENHNAPEDPSKTSSEIKNLLLFLKSVKKEKEEE